jgi:hypothetical protein
VSPSLSDQSRRGFNAAAWLYRPADAAGVPDLVSTTSPTALTPDGTLGLNYIGLISPIVKAVQAIYADVLSLEQTVSGYAQSFTTNKLCVNKSDGTPVCVTGDQLNALLAAQKQSPSSSGDQSSAAPEQSQAAGTSTP